MSPSKPHSELSFVEKLDLLLTGAEKGYAASSHSTPADRLVAWVDDIQLFGRVGTPHYANPGELKADIRSLVEQFEVRTQNLRDCNERSRALAEKCVALIEQFEVLRIALEKVADWDEGHTIHWSEIARDALDASFPASEPEGSNAS